MTDGSNIKYIHIKNDIKHKIHTNELKADDKIPSEAQLCLKYNVSKITTTKALNELVAEGYLYRIQGKGTFVKETQISERVSSLSGFTARMKKQNLALQTEVLETRNVLIPQKMSDFFSLPRDIHVILLKRLRIVDKQPLCLSISYLMPEFFYWVVLEDMEKESLYDLLENKYNFHLGHAIQEFTIGYLNKKNASCLKITEKDPCLKLSLFSYLENSRPAQFEETYYLGTKYSYQIFLESPKAGDHF